MTKDRARKQAIRARMAGSGEPYTVAARHLAGFADPAGVVAACAAATLAETGARMGIRVVTRLPWVETAETPREQRRRGVQGVARRLLGALVHDGTHVAGEGFAALAARRYMTDCGPSGGFMCRDGAMVQGRHGWRVRFPPAPGDRPAVEHWLWSLWALTGTATARAVGTEAVRGVACQRLIANIDPARALAAGGEGWPASFRSGPEARPGPEALTTAALAVWIDDRHVRRVRFDASARAVGTELPDRVTTIEIELWDFGASVAHLDWSRIP